MSSSDDEVMDDEVMDDDDRFQLKLFLDDSASDEEHFEDDDTSSNDDGRFKLRRHIEFDENDFIEEDDDDLLDDEDEEPEFRHSSSTMFPAPMPWPPAIVSQQNQIQNEQNASGKKKKPGIIYLSSIPTDYNVARTITFFSQFGKIGRVFLQPDIKEKAKRRDKMARNFTEGWVEFLSKRVAKEVAVNLNSTQVGGSKRSKAHDVLWNIKYLPRFKWTHLSERLAYERASHTQRLRAEVSQAKREADFYRSNVEKSRKMLKRAKTQEASEESGRLYEFRQKETDDVMRNKRSRDEDNSRVESEQSKKKSKKAKNKNRHSNEMSHKSGKKDKRLSGEMSQGSQSKRARTRSSDRKEFLQSVFGAKT